MSRHPPLRWRWRSPAGIALLVCLGIVAFLLVAKAPVLPWLFLLICPLMHLFMHGDHAGKGKHSQDH
ncbi:DUF2933 domain-containing protein [Acaryochloris thomasi]|uniref:DUF2933 domain-containing protein n=1 Tax=Acaryochloris thomasi TaxID=2929456 RepID=UPI000DA6460F|nr:DUF2933 domain-containing protein [Acaryochloris thomasi]